MKRPSERALNLADEILDYLRPGLTRADALHELAEMVDRNNSKRLRAARAVAGNAAFNGCLSDTATLARLKKVLSIYPPHAVAESHSLGFLANVSATPTPF